MSEEPLSHFRRSVSSPSDLTLASDEVVNDERVYNQCAVPSGMIEFFELASEMWFFCVAFDLAVSITNPFSSFKARSPPSSPDSHPPSG
jgi:hypothetical protein